MSIDMKPSRVLLATAMIAALLAAAGCRQTTGPSGESLGGNSVENAGGEAEARSASPIRPVAQQSRPRVTIRAGTLIDVRLTDPIGSAQDRSGETFQATLAEPLMANGMVAVPRGAVVTGKVLVARPSGHLRTPAELAVTLTAVEVAGKSYAVVTSERRWRGASHKKRDAEWIGGAAGAGALIGALVGHGKGAAIGAGIGAGGGTATAYATGKKDIYLPPETRLRFVLREPVTIANH
jgi:hypothetical protein